MMSAMRVMDARITLRVPSRTRVWVEAYARRRGISNADSWRRLMEAGLRALDVAPEVRLPVAGDPVPDRSRLLTPDRARQMDPLAADTVIEHLRDKIAAHEGQDRIQTDGATRDLTSAAHDFYGKPLLPGYTRDGDTWRATHPRRPPLWIGERDADGNPLVED